MTYEETIELELNVKIKNKAQEIYKGFVDNTSLSLKDYKNGRFKLWCDSNNAKYLDLKSSDPVLILDYINNNHRITVTPSSIFSAIKSMDRFVTHLASMAKVKLNLNDYQRRY